MDPFPPTEQQQAVIDHRGANLLVFAGPGTGKTETLARRFAALVAEGTAPSRILVLTFSRRAADEMRDRVLLRLRQAQGSGLAVSELFVRTFHGFCRRLLEGDDLRLQRRELMTPVRERLLWRELMRTNSLALASFDPSISQSSRFATDCLNIIAHLKGQGVTPAHLFSLAREDARLTDIAAIFAAMEAQREKSGLRDYRDLVNEAVAALHTPGSRACTWLRGAAFAHVLVDEFQDSDPMQLRLLEAVRSVMTPTPLFCFVGDVNQSIYRFRGASPENVEGARTAFDCQTLLLRDNRRSAQAILDVANADVSLAPASLTSAADPRKVGSVQLVRPRTSDDEVRAIRDAIVAKVSSGVPPRAIAVLLRTTQPYQELIAGALTAAGIPVAALPASGFHEDALIDAVLTSLRLLEAPGEERLWRRLLSNPIVGFKPIDVRAAFDAGHRAQMTDPLAMLRVYPPQGIRPIDAFLHGWKACAKAHRAAPPVELVQTIVYELDLLRPVRERDPVAGFDATASPLRLDALVQAAQDHSTDGGEDSGTGVGEFIAHLDETVGLLAETSEPPPALEGGVRVMSIHAAKGLEFDFVVIPQLLDGWLPASEQPSGLLPARSRRTLAHAGIDVMLGEQDARREEHSLWYVALTRARRDVLATAALVDDEGVELQLSPFAGPIVVAPPATDGHPAAEQLALELPVEEKLALVPTTTDDDRRETAWPVRLPMDSLSPTGINTFLTCPRRFFYGNVVRLPSRDDDATQYGKLLHDALRRFHELETSFEDIGDPAAAVARYRSLFGEIIAEVTATGTQDPGLTPLARFEREDLEQRLGRYAERLPELAATSPFTVLACEREVVSAIGDVAVRGKVDRIDRLASGGLAVRDYKSGRMHGGLAVGLRRAFANIDAGKSLFGDAPDGLNVQTLLYIPGVEQLYGEPVVQVEYIYFRGKNADDSDLRMDTTTIAASAHSGADLTLSRSDIERVERDIASRIVTMCRSGELTVFATTHDERTCTFCSFVRICPGPGAVA